jgi:putative ABC transport system permease protein
MTFMTDSTAQLRGLPWLETVMQDLHFGLRMLRRSPAFAAMAVITLGLGIGANTAMFSVVNSVLLPRLPFNDPGRVLYVAQKQANGALNVFSLPDFVEWKRQTDLLGQMAALRPAGFTLGVGDQPEQISGARFSYEMFSVLGVNPALGRPFTAGEDQAGASAVAVLSDSLWRTRFKADREILGTKIDLDNAPTTIIGVMPPGFYVLGNKEQVWAPLQLQTTGAAAASRTVHSIWAIARLAPGKSVAQEQAQLDTIAERLHREDAKDDGGYGVQIQRYQDALTDGLRQALWLLMGCVGFVLLIACCNVANLLLARASGRTTEIAVRVALGAHRNRIVRQLLTESMLLAVLGGLLGIALAKVGLKLLVTLHPSSVPQVETISLDGFTLLFTLIICLPVAILFGIAPALATAKVDVSNAMRESSRGSSGSMGKHRAALVISETALASILLIGAGLSLKSLWHVSQVDPGFNPANLMTFKVARPASAEAQPEEFYRRVAEKIGTLPGVEMVALGRDIPLGGTDPSMPVAADGKAAQVTDGQVVTRLRVIGPGYFKAFQTPMLRGRELTESDTATGQSVVVISQSLAQRYWPEGEPIGHRIKPNIADAPWYTVVGVAADVRHQGLDSDVEPTAYYPLTQMPKSTVSLVSRYSTVVIRTRGHITGLTESVRKAVASVDKTVAIYSIQTVDDMLSDAGSLRRFDMWLLGGFAGLALALAAIGVYGVMAYSVAQRTKEIGILMALGAQRPQVLRMVLMQGARMAVAGVVIGIAGGLALTRLMASLLYQVSPIDIATFGFVSLIVLALILLACIAPSLRATRIDPIMALRHE